MAWSGLGALVRARRAALGLLDDEALAARSGIAVRRVRDLASHVDAEPVAFELHALATALNLDRKLLEAAARGRAEVPELVQGVVDDARTPRFRDVEPFTGTLSVGKTSTAYRAHSYHTKCPPEAIKKLIAHYTEPGALVVDPFSGSGMTGVAALMAGRNAIISDLSPAAVHISRNYTSPCSPSALVAAGERVHDQVHDVIQTLYGLRRGMVEHTVWSDVFACSSCGARMVYWDCARRASGKVAEKVRCPRCRKTAHKRNLRWIDEVPVETVTSSHTGRSRHAPTRQERALVAAAASMTIPYWTPEVPFTSSREMWRAAHTAAGIDSVTDFFTRRNLHALSAIRAAVMREPDDRLRDALLFAFTACVNRASKRYQWNAKRPTNVMTGTLYISSLRYEWNVWRLFSRKLRDVIRYFEHLGTPSGECTAVQSSATSLDHLPDGIADFVFLDPPFGSNIFYADSSLLWDAWLGAMTDEHQEIVVNKHRKPDAGGKTLDDYQRLMSAALCEVGRVLKPGARATLQFNNTDDEVWVALQQAFDDAGLVVDGATGLDKLQPSIKGVKGRQEKENVASRDALISLRRAPRKFRQAKPVQLDELIRLILKRKRTPVPTDVLYGELVQRVLASGSSLAGVSMQAVRDTCATVACWTGKGWTVEELDVDEESTNFTKVASPYGCVVERYVASRAELHALVRPEVPPAQVDGGAPRSVPGTRNSALYNAHSYHTKVPPEAIVPFIQHFTRPGDVVLDPFSGSGMTGVAAVLSGRRAVLNDLSVVGSHLAFNHTHPCDPAALTATFLKLYERLRPEFEKLYGTEGGAGRGYVYYTLWARDAVCPACSTTTSLWDVIDRETGRMPVRFTCPKCGATTSKQALKYSGNAPVLVSYANERGERAERVATDRDRAHVEFLEHKAIEHWFPDVEVSPNREMYIRSALQLVGVRRIADLYTKRNLAALALLWAEINTVDDDRLRAALQFAFTNTAWHGTRMRRFNARGGQRPLTGTLYVPQLSSEANVLEVMKNKVKQLRSFYEALRPADPTIPAPAIKIGSATNLADIPDQSIDYIFTDPPFGSNLFYADCNLIWEAWLGGLTQVEREAVVNRSLRPERGGKTLGDYQRLMTEALREMHRVLKPGGWTTLVFHNTDPDVWRSLQEAAASAGFELLDAGELDRQQQSHKGYKGRADVEAVAHFDVIMSMRKSEAHARRKPGSLSLTQVRAIIRDAARGLSEEGVSVQRVHSAVIQRLIRDGLDVGAVTFDLVREEVATLATTASRRSRARQPPLPL